MASSAPTDCRHSGTNQQSKFECHFCLEFGGALPPPNKAANKPRSQIAPDLAREDKQMENGDIVELFMRSPHAPPGCFSSADVVREWCPDPGSALVDEKDEDGEPVYVGLATYTFWRDGDVEPSRPVQDALTNTGLHHHLLLSSGELEKRSHRATAESEDQAVRKGPETPPEGSDTRMEPWKGETELGHCHGLFVNGLYGYTLLSLMENTPDSGAWALRGSVHNYLAGNMSIKVTKSFEGQRRFLYSFDLEQPLLRRASEIANDVPCNRKDKPLRKSEDLSGLCEGAEDFILLPGHVTVNISGPNHRRWQARCFIDRHLGHRGIEEYFDFDRSESQTIQPEDPLRRGKDATLSSRDPRQYFLEALASYLEAAWIECDTLIGFLEVRIPCKLSTFDKRIKSCDVSSTQFWEVSKEAQDCATRLRQLVKKLQDDISIILDECTNFNNNRSQLGCVEQRAMARNALEHIEDTISNFTSGFRRATRLLTAIDPFKADFDKALKSSIERDNLEILSLARSRAKLAEEELESLKNVAKSTKNAEESAERRQQTTEAAHAVQAAALFLEILSAGSQIFAIPKDNGKLPFNGVSVIVVMVILAAIISVAIIAFRHGGRFGQWIGLVPQQMAMAAFTTAYLAFI